MTLKDDPCQTHSEHSGDEERPLQRVNQFQPSSSSKRRNSSKKNDTLKRINSKSHDDTVTNSSTSNASMVKMIETLRQSSQRDKQQLSDKIDSLQNRLDEVLSLLTAQNALLHDIKNREQVIPAPTTFSNLPPAPPPTVCNKPANLGLPPPPPPPSNHAPSFSQAPPPPPIQGGGPPPPPPPPPAPKSTETRGKTLAEQLAEAKLKKEFGKSSNSAPEVVPKAMGTIDFSTELQNRIKKRTGNPVIN